MPPNDGHFHLVVNPSATKGRGPRHSTRQICHRMTTIFIPGQFHRQPTGGVPFVVPRHSTRPNCIKMTTIFIPRQFHRRPTGGPIGHQTTAIFIPRQFLVIPRGRYATKRRAPFSSKSPNSGGLCPNPIEKCSKRRNDTRSEIGCHFKLERSKRNR